MKNYSRQREEILEELKGTYDHPTAEEIYKRVKLKDEMISRSTVYRNLNELVENKIIKRFPSSNSNDRYDFVDEVHNHVVCSKCGKIFDFKYRFNFNRIKETVEEQTGVLIENEGIVFEGICKDCMNEQNNK